MQRLWMGCDMDFADRTPLLSGLYKETQMNQVSRLKAVGALTALLMALGLIFSMTAQASACQTVTFADGYISGRSGNTTSVHTGLIGSNLWVNTGELEDTADLGVGSVTHEVPEGAISATACEDGSISFELGADPMPTPVVVDIPATPVDPPTVTSEPVADPQPLSDAIPWAPVEARV